MTDAAHAGSGHRVVPLHRRHGERATDQRVTGDGRFDIPLRTSQDAIGGAQLAIDEILAEHPQPRVLEAGCGSLSHVSFGDRAHVVGMDIDPAKLEKNDDVAERILGDVETYELPTDNFDAIVCWYVFEHLDHPLAALVRFARAARPGGVVVLALPNVLTPKGLVTKFTPFSFHVLVKRYLMGRPNAGKPGYGPYPTTIPFAISPEQLLAVAAAAGLEPAYACFFEDDKQASLRERVGLRGPVWRGLSALVRGVSRGRLDAERTELVLVLRRRG